MHVISPLQSSNSTKAAFISHHYCCITLQHTFGIWESSPSNKKATCLWVVFNHLKQKNFFHRVTLFYYAQSIMEKIISQWKLTPLHANKNNKNTMYIHCKNENQINKYNWSAPNSKIFFSLKSPIRNPLRLFKLSLGIYLALKSYEI